MNVLQSRTVEVEAFAERAPFPGKPRACAVAETMSEQTSLAWGTQGNFPPGCIVASGSEKSATSISSEA